MEPEFKLNRYPWYAPRFWNGLRVSDYWRLLWRHRFAVHPTRWPMMTLVGGCACFNSFWGAIQDLTLRRKILATPIEPPIFVVGHWRTGTTLLHELLARDKQFSYPTNFDCFVPSHFLVTRTFFAPVVAALLPKKRPMDDMTLAADAPQEDEFAVCALGGPTPYWRVAFPNHGAVDQDLLNFDTAPPELVERYRVSLEFFFRALHFRYGRKPLVLKSPPHTGRIRKLAEWFPDARFVHIAREPTRVVQSTLKLWSAIDRVQGFQPPRYSSRDLLAFVMDSYRRMYDGYFAQRSMIEDNRLIEVRLEDLTRQPDMVLNQIYRTLDLSVPAELSSNVAAYFNSHEDHRPDQVPLDEAFVDQVNRQWSDYRTAFGY